MNNLHTVQEMYAAFERGDIASIVAKMAPDVEWEYGATPNAAPWLQPRKGRENVPQFFVALQQLDFRQFRISGIYGGARTIVALLDIEFVVKATGKVVKEVDEVHIWQFDEAGLVARFRHRADTHQQHLAATK